MSSTNRGSERLKDDAYQTPPWCVHRFLEAVPLPGGDWLEPSVGVGNLVRGTAGIRLDVSWTVVEKNAVLLQHWTPKETPSKVYVADYLRLDLLSRREQPFDVALGNPPYSLAMDFLKKLWDEATIIALLLRNGFWSSQERNSFMQEFPPDMYGLPNRPGFRRKGTDSCEYVWYVWPPPPERRREFGRFKVLDVTARGVRAAEKKERTWQ